MKLLGPHVIKPSGDALDWAKHANVVKALDDASALRATSAKVRIFRRYFPTQDINRNGGTVLDDVLAALGNAPATHVELYNECFQRLGYGLERYVEFTREAVARLHERRPDLAIVAFCFSTGNPEQDDWLYLKAHGYGGASVIGLHEYWGAQAFSGWNALRYRKVHDWTGSDHPPFLITECGRDKVEGGKGGWKADGLTEDAYFAELRAYDAEITKDAYVLGATVFTCGPTPDWRNFDADPIAGRAIAAAEPYPPRQTPKPTGGTMPAPITRQKILANAASYEGVPYVWAADDPPNGLDCSAFVCRCWEVSRRGTDTIGEFCQPITKDDLAAGDAMNLTTLADPNGYGHIRLFEKWADAARTQMWVWEETEGVTPGRVVHRVINYDARYQPVRRLDVTGGEAMPTPTDPPRDATWALLDQLQALAPQWAAAGWPSAAVAVGEGAELIKSIVRSSKGEK